MAVRLENIPPGSSSLAVLPVTGGELQIIVRDAQIVGGVLNFTPDSLSILWARPLGKKSELWMVSASGGTPVRLGLEMESGGMVRLSPDGRQIAFTVNKSGEEIWVMENFLNP